MKNRKQEISNLENEIEQKQQILNELKAEEQNDRYNVDLTQEKIEEIVNKII
jgi:uncharacterized membrane protein YgaE (UPF0421/DUF939 family)